MFNSPVIDLVILLSFTYFVGSLLLSTINEFVVSIFKYRQEHLKDALENLFFNKEWKSFVTDKLIKSPHMESLFGKEGKYPSYIPAKNFTFAIIEKIGAANFAPDKLATLADSIDKNPELPASLKTVLKNILAKTQNNIEAFEKELDSFYNDAMDRAGGWYKRKVKIVMMILAFIIATIMNVDTIKISNDALRDKDKLSKMADNISAEMAKISLDTAGTVTIKDTAGKVIVQVSSTIDTVVTKNVSSKETMQKVKNLDIVYTQNAGMHYGYPNGFCNEWKCDGNYNFLKKLLGIIITVFALQLGANFWFDLLNKAVNMRGGGKKPEQDKEK